jgi:hypothetical protein
MAIYELVWGQISECQRYLFICNAYSSFNLIEKNSAKSSLNLTKTNNLVKIYKRRYYLHCRAAQ